LDNHHNKQAGFTLAYNLVPQTLYGDYAFADVTDDISAGRIIIRPFVDVNGNGVYDTGEEILKGLRFRNMLRGSLSTTASDGTVLLSGLTPSLANRIVVDDTSITDIYLTPAKKELIVLGKAGVNGPIDFPFSKLGSISGTLVTADATGHEIPLAEAQMILLDKGGKQVADTYSESDGYFSFDSVPIGSYEIFFPASEALEPYYAGKGEGPALNLTVDKPAVEDIKIKVEHDRILMTEGEKAPPIAAQFPTPSAPGAAVPPAAAKPAAPLPPIENAPMTMKLDKKAETPAPPPLLPPAGMKPAPTLTPPPLLPPAGVKSAPAPTPPKPPVQTPASPKASNEARSIRFADYKDKTRVVVDMSAKTSGGVTVGKDGKTLIIDLAGMSWLGPQSWEADSAQLISGYHVEGSTLYIDLMYASKIKNRDVLAPTAKNKQYRLVIDLFSSEIHKAK
jgi:hypothetical protein